MTDTPTAWIVGLTRAAGTVVGCSVRCPHCSGTHHHPWPVRNRVPSPCSPFSQYRVDFWTTTPNEGGTPKCD